MYEKIALIGYSQPALRSGFKIPSKAQWRRCPACAGFASDFAEYYGAAQPPIYAHPPQADCAFPIGLRLDAYINMLKSDM